MRVEVTVDPSTGEQRKHYIFEPDEKAFYVGPYISGIKTLADGTSINIGPEYIAVADDAQAAELNDLIGKHFAENGHPSDVDTLIDPETGAEVPVQRPFVFEDSKGKTHVGVGTPVGEHPLDDVQPEAKASKSSKES